ncbi:hypothetical protein [Candidatus Pyrohabitans sp.]
MRNNAQITLETILIIGFFLLILVGITIPMSFKASDASRDASRVLEVRNNLDKITTAIKVVQVLGPGAVRTVRITSNSRSWALASGDPVMNASISYWAEWESRARVPAELVYTNVYNTSRHFGGMGRNISGISAGNFNYTYFDGRGSFVVRVENNNTQGGDSYLLIASSGNNISITLSP